MAALCIQSCWRGFLARRSYQARIRTAKTGKCPPSGSQSARRKETPRRVRRQNSEGNEKATTKAEAAEIPQLTVDEARQLAQQRVRSARGKQGHSDQKVPVAAPVPSAGKRHTVSELLEQEAAYRASLPKLAPAPQRASQTQASRASSREKSGQHAAPGPDAKQRQQGSVDRTSRKEEGASRAPREDRSNGAGKRLPKAVTPRTGVSSGWVQKTDPNANRLRTPRALGVGVGMSEHGSGYAVSSCRSWG